MTCSMWLRQKVREPEFEPAKSERWSQDPNPGSPTLWWLQDSYPPALPLKPVCFIMWNEAQCKNNLILKYLYWLFTVQMYFAKAFNIAMKSVYLKNKYCFKKGGTCFPPSFLPSFNKHARVSVYSEHYVRCRGDSSDQERQKWEKTREQDLMFILMMNTH